MKKCFIVCPIGEEGTETRRRSDQVFRHIIEPVCENNGYTPIRVDKINDTDSINQTIINHLINSELVITDLTDHNPNAFYESGYRLALGKPLIQLISEDQKLPFDVAGTRTIFYNLNDLDKVESVKEKLNETIKTVASNTESSSNKNNLVTNNADDRNSKVFSLLLDIKDSIENLTTDIKNKDKSDMEQMISVLVNQLGNNSSSNAEMKLMELMIPEMMNNPEKVKNFMSLAELAGKHTK